MDADTDAADAAKYLLAKPGHLLSNLSSWIMYLGTYSTNISMTHVVEFQGNAFFQKMA